MTVPADLIKISDTIWELPTSHKPGMLVPARIYATDALMQMMDDGVFGKSAMLLPCPALCAMPIACPMATGAMAFPLAVSLPWTPPRGHFAWRHRL